MPAVAIVPIEYVERGQSTVAAHAARAPQLDASRRQAGGVGERLWHLATSLATAAADQKQWDEEVMRRSLLVQPFADEVVTSGEWSVVFFDGEYSHAVLKKPAAGDFRVQEELGGHGEPRDPSPAIVEQARRVLSHAAGPLLYARVDGIERDAEFVLMELEINEPFLYIGSSSGARETLRGRDCSHDRQHPLQSAVRHLPAESAADLRLIREAAWHERPLGTSHPTKRQTRYSARSAIIGSTRAARCAGRSDASSVTAMSAPATTA